MFLPRSILLPRSWTRCAKPSLGLSTSTRRQEPRTRRRAVWLEVLEDRTLLSTWVPEGPAPILNGASGDPVTGRIAGIAADPSDPNTLYIAAAGGGVWKTIDGGTNWIPLTDSQQTLFMGAIAVAPSDPNIIYAGTGEATNSLLSYYGRGVLKSTDAGATWTLLGNAQFDRRTIAKVVVSPADPNTVYVAVSASGTNGVVLLNPGTGIWRSTDGGTTWTNTTTKISTTQDYSDLVLDPLDPQTLFAAVGTSDGSVTNGIYKTTDGGNTWGIAGNFARGRNNGNVRVAIAPSNDSILYASIANPTTGTLSEMIKSVDGGASWTQLASTPNYMGTIGWYASTLAVDPLNPNTVYAAGAAGITSVIRSLDGGATWSSISVGSDGRGPHVDHHAVTFDAAGRLLDGNDGGIWRLDNQAPVRWTDLNGNLGITQFISIALHPTDPTIAYGGSQDNGTEKFTGSSGWTLSQGGDGGFVRIDFTNPQTVYHTFYWGTGTSFLQRSDNGGASWIGKTNGISLSDTANFYPPYIVDPSNSSHLLLGTNRVYETTNRADSWTALSTPNANGWTSSSAIDSLAIAPSDANTIYATAGGLIFVTTDHGASWQKRNIPSVTDSIADLLVDPANSLIAYAVRNEFDGGHVFYTTNGGLTWINISGNLPNLPAYTIALGAGALYVGNDDGVYASTDGGSTWSRLGDGLPHAQVRELVFNANLGILAAGTHGRGMWELSLGGVATQFSVTVSANSVTAGTTLQITVMAVDAQNNPISGYTGTVHFTSSDPAATLPGDYTFTAADAGVHTFDVTLVQAGNQTVTVIDSATGLTGSAAVEVSPAAADHFSVGAPADSSAGSAFDVTVTALDPYNNIDVNYQGTVTFTTTDAGAGVVLPPETTFTAADAGVHTFSGGVTLVTAGGQSLTVTDTSSGITGTASIAVTAAAPDHLLLLAPATVVAGVAFDVVVMVQDAFNNTVLTYLGAVQFTSSDTDPGVLLPPDYAFSNDDAGQHTFAGGVTLFTPGTQTLRVDDLGLGIAGEASIDVTVPAPPGGGGGASGPGGGRFSVEIDILRLAPLAPPSLLIPTVPSTVNLALPIRSLNAASVAALFAANSIEDGRGIARSYRLWTALMVEELEAAYRLDGALLPSAGAG